GGSLEEARFDGADIIHSLLNGTHPRDTRFSGADLADSRFTNARMEKTDFTAVRNIPAHLKKMLEETVGPR
ncbi:MAG TPA: pentapeptide repeat-containing protein, partial [Chromatiaceae bacterium]|nr:pentapeptide repeat-containing protein [Chromatiaceae bacterium]